MSSPPAATCYEGDRVRRWYRMDLPLQYEDNPMSAAMAELGRHLSNMGRPSP